MAGSSPLARGLLRAAGTRRCISRIIPARAGFTRQVGFHLGILKDHPRSRGVYQTRLIPLVIHVGSSPLARGLRLYAPHTRDRAGIIPARAGFT